LPRRGFAASRPPFRPEPDGASLWGALFAGLVFYFFLLRPQMSQQKAQKAKIAGIKKGDQVVTAGGLIARVIKVEDQHVELELGPNVRVKAVRSTISDVVLPGGAPAND